MKSVPCSAKITDFYTAFIKWLWLRSQGYRKALLLPTRAASFMLTCKLDYYDIPGGYLNSVCWLQDSQRNQTTFSAMKLRAKGDQLKIQMLYKLSMNELNTPRRRESSA